MRVLVTGHLGYLGARIVPLLRNAGMEVVGLDSGLFRDCAIAPPEPVPGIEKDIRDAEAMDVAGFDAVIHLAGFSSEELGHIHPALTFEVNFEATLRLAQLAKEAGVRRFLFASSTSVYGPGSAARGEGSPLAPESPYAVSKALAEEELARLATDSFCPVVLRTAHPYGLSPSLRFEPVLNHLVAQAAIDVSDGLVGDIDKLCQVSHVGARIEAARVPLSDAAQKVLAREPDLLPTLITAGDDYGVVLAISEKSAPSFESEAQAAGARFTLLGTVMEAAKGVAAIDAKGQPISLKRKGFSHF